MRIALLACSIALLAGCATGPTYRRPDVAVPPAYRDDASPPSGWQPIHPALADQHAWWQIYGDPRLDALQAEVNISNQTILKAVATLQEARASVGVARSGYFPTVTAGAAQSRFLTSNNVLGKSLAGKTVSDYSLGADAQWEPDLFDKVGHAVDAATARAQASAADLAAVSLSVHAELAIDYFDLCAADAQIALLEKTTRDDADALALVKHRFDTGIASASDVAQAQAQFDGARAERIGLDVGRRALEHAIATLIGKPAPSFQQDTAATIPDPPTIPAGVPATLLQRRPDVAASERRVAAAHADVGQAHAAFFPDLVLSASGGLESSHAASWLAMPSRFWAVGPALVGTLLDGGRRRHEEEAAQASYDASVADYRQTTLIAFQDVQDQLSATQVLARQAQAQAAAVASSQQALQLAIHRYEAGAVSYLEVITAQSTALADQRADTEVARQRLDASVRLIKALGGDWNEPSAPLAQARSSK